MDSAASIVLVAIAAAILLPIAVYLIYKMFGLIFLMLGNTFKFVGAEIRDACKLVGSVIVIPIFSLLVLLNVVIGRWSASAHFGRNIGAEFNSIGASTYRLIVGNPARLVGLGTALEGVEERLPAAMAEAPGRDRPKGGKAGQFEGYTIIGSLPVGGSGARLYIAEPEVMKRAALERRGMADVDRVVIKAFSQSDGSTLDQIVRESRALEAAKELGLVLEHSSEADRFYYVMRYVPGDSLGVVTHRLHAASPADGLDAKSLRHAMGYAADLIDSLHTYHRGGLWHKDIKPDNIIIDRTDNKAHLVDFGLVTPMRSAMTLTTHGTEYFRDPELVRQALRGVKVNEIDGAKFDVYSAGAVMFSVIENSFPAHGGLSQITKKCPDALKWVVRRAMADYQRRYTSAAEMRRDIEVVLTAANPFSVKPADLPSMQGDAAGHAPQPAPEPMPERPSYTPPPYTPPHRAAQAVAGGAVASAGPVAAAAAGAPKGTPKIRLADWWKGTYTAHAAAGAAAAGSAPEAPQPAPQPFAEAGEKVKSAWGTASAKMRETARAHREGGKVEHRATPAARVVPAESRAPASDQLRNARDRVRATRAKARQRASGRVAPVRRANKTSAIGGTRGLVFGIILATVVFFAMITLAAALLTNLTRTETQINQPEAFASAVTSDGTQITMNADGFAIATPSMDPEDYLARMPILEERVLVLSDLASPIDSALRESINRAFGMLGDSGATMRGDLVTLVDDADTDLLDLLARVRTDRGALPLDSDELGDRLRKVLRDIRSEYDGVLWVGPVKGRPEAVEYVLIGPEGVVSSEADDLEAVIELAEEIDDLD